MVRIEAVRIAFSVLAFAASLFAQQARLDALDRRGAPEPVGSVAWFSHRLERVEAMLAIDVRAAFEEAKKIVDAAGPTSPPGVRSAAIALTAVVCSRLEGPASGAAWLAKAGEPPAECDDRIRAAHHMSRARCLCYLGHHDQELQWAIPGQACAERTGDPVLELRAAFTTLHATQQRGVASLRKKFEQLSARPNGADIDFYRPVLLLEEHIALKENGHDDEATAALDEAERRAVATGSIRAQALCAAFRGNGLTMRRQLEEAATQYDRARELYDRLGDLPERIGVRDIHAWLDIQRHQLDAAADRLAEAEELVRDRGFDDLEKTLLQTQLELAVRRRDGNAAAALAQELEQRQAAAREHERRIAQYRSSLQAAEEQRDSLMAKLELEQAEDAQRELEARIELGVAALSMLLALLGYGWRARRRLRCANLALAEQVKRVEEARAVQAKLEERLRETERAECLQTLAAGLAHDFNNLLTSIQGNAELLRNDLHSAVGAQGLESVLAATRQAARLCKQLQVYAGGPPPAGVEVDLRAAVAEMLPVLRAAAPVQVELESQGGCAVVARIDRVQLEQVMLNLVVNARDANAKHVRIRIDTTESARGVSSPAATIEVEDDGDGMTKEVAARVFDPFFTTRFPGRGLGLAVVHGAVRRHGGVVTVSSEAGHGSTFAIHLPLTSAAKRSEPTVVLQPQPRAQPLLLVVDDDEAVRRVLSLMLANLGAEIATFANGTDLLDAVRAAPANRPLVAIVDLDMPGLDGQDVLREVRALRGDCRRVLLSGHPTVYLDAVVQEVQPDLVLAKPLRREALRTAITPLLQPGSGAGAANDRSAPIAGVGNRDS